MNENSFMEPVAYAFYFGLSPVITEHNLFYQTTTLLHIDLTQEY